MPDIFLNLYYAARAIIIVVDIALLFTFIFAWYQLIQYRPHFIFDPLKYAKKHKAKSLKNKAVTDSWSGILAKVAEASPDALRTAVIDADSLVDDVMKRMGRVGETFADRLATFPSEDPIVDHVWDAHRLRNEMVHSTGFQASVERAKRAVADYEAFLKDIKAL